MQKAVLTVLATITLSAPAAATTSAYLVRQWFEGGNNFCQYSNGTVLNMGLRFCPYSI